MTVNIFLKRVLALGLVVCCFFISVLVVNKGHFRFFAKGAGETVLYVGGNGAADSNSGEKEAPLATLAGAYAKIPANNVKTYIVICGTVEVGESPRVVLKNNYYYLAKHDGEVVITSVYGADDYRESAELSLSGIWDLMGN